MEKGTFISSLSPYPEEEYFLGKSSWSTSVNDWKQRFEVGDVVADPSGSWEPSTAQQYIDSQIATVNTNLANETISRQTGDRNLQTQLQSEMNTRAAQDANLNALINAGIREGGGVQFDIVPTQNSANGITSGGMYSTLKDSNIGFVDETPTAGSDNLVKSGGIYNSPIVFQKITGLKDINLFNVEEQVSPNIIDNSYLHDGILGSSYSYFVSSKIPLIPGFKYALDPFWNTSGEGYRGACFTKDDVFISNINGNFTAPLNASYARLTVYKIGSAQAWKKYRFYVGETLPSYNVPFGSEITWLRLTEKQLNLSGNRWLGKKINCLGDSITASYGVVSDVETYPSVVGEILGLSVVRNYGIPGSTIGVPQEGEHNPMVLRYSDMDDDADIITFMGGSNDIAYVPLGTIADEVNTTYYGALKILCNGLISKYPNKLIIGITPSRRLGVNLDTFKQYADAFIEVCRMYSIPCLDLYYSGGIYPSNQDQEDAIIPDGLHPNADGRRMIAYKLAGMIRSN